jgi:hypothetical protein
MLVKYRKAEIAPRSHRRGPMRTGNQTECGKLIEMPKPSRTRAGLNHIGTYLDRETVEKVAILRARLGLDNSKLIKPGPPPWPAKPPKPQPPKPPAPPPPPMVEEALALIDRLPPTREEREMNELARRTWELLLHDLRVTAWSPPGYRESDAGGRGKRITGALREVIRHCFGNYARWRKSPE